MPTDTHETTLIVHPDGTARLPTDALATLGVNGEAVQADLEIAVGGTQPAPRRYSVPFELHGRLVVEDAADAEDAMTQAEAMVWDVDADSLSLASLGPATEVLP